MAKTFVRLASLLAPAVLVALGATAAQAGFEWKGPMSPPVRQAPAASAAVPAETEMSGLEPVIMWEGEATPPIAWADTAMPAEKVGEVEKAAIGADATPVAIAEPAPADLTAAETAADPGEEISGFGTDLPLVIALQQVVPPGYQFSFASGVNPGSLVSWEGGKSWKAVLSDMLAAQGLGYKINNNAVVIGYFKSEEQKPARIPLPVKAEKIPDGLLMPPTAPVQDAAASAAISSEPVDIRRQKPSSLLKKQAAAEAAQVQADTQLPPVATTHAAETAAARPQSIASAPLAVTDIAGQPQAPSPVWAGAKGQTLRDVIKNWSDVAGVELYWSIDYDYRLNEDVGYPGTFDEAVGKLLDRFATVRPQPYGQLHQSSDGPRVLVVKSYDLTK